MTAEHIRHGIRNKCTECVIALAINDVLKPEYVVLSGLYEIVIVQKDQANSQIPGILQSFRPPAFITEYMRRFDRAEPVEPTTFNLDIKEELLRCISESPPS